MPNRSKPPVSPRSQRCLLTEFPGALRLPGLRGLRFLIRLRQASLFIRYAEEREQHGSAEPCSAGASPIICKPPRDWKSRHLRSPGKRSAPGSLIRVQMPNRSKPPVSPRLQRCLLTEFPGALRLPGLRGLRFLIKLQQASLFTRYAEEREQRGSAVPSSAGASPADVILTPTCRSTRPLVERPTHIVGVVGCQSVGGCSGSPCACAKRLIAGSSPNVLVNCMYSDRGSFDCTDAEPSINALTPKLNHCN